MYVIIITALIVAAACDQRTPAPASRDTVPADTQAPPGQTHRGHYSYGFETSEFVPCGLDERWWVRGQEGAVYVGLLDRLRRFDPKVDSPAAKGRVYAEFRGDTTARGRYGHVGGYQRELVLHEVLDVRPVRPDDCK